MPISNNESSAFFRHYLVAIESSGLPPISKIRDLVSEVLMCPGFSPSDPKLEPLHAFVSNAIVDKAPLEWLDAPPFLPFLSAYHQVRHFLQALDDQGKVLAVDPEHRTAHTPSHVKNFVFRMIATEKARTLAPQGNENAIRQELDAIGQVTVVVKNDAYVDHGVVLKN
jgi:hypothetical protein